MARTPDPARKPALLAQTLEFLLDKPLATLSFRTLAASLGVSTFTLVYHFGTRAELIHEVVRAISERATFMERRLVDNVTLDTYFGNLRLSWEWTLEPRNRQLQRLEFEAAMLESLYPEEYTFGRQVHGFWRRIGRDALAGFGLSDEDAEVETRLLVDTVLGIQYDFVLNDDEAGATAAFHRLMENHRARIEQLVDASARTVG
jgi:AcrR family transcriptional regulator